MEPVHRRLEPHSQQGRLGDHRPRRNHELVDKRRQGVTERCRLVHGGLTLLGEPLLERGAGTLCVGLVGHRVKGALDPIGLRSDPWSVLDPRRMRMDGGVSANCFDQRDVEQVASRLIFTATHDPRVSGTSHTKFVPVWRLRNPLSHPRVPPRLPQRFWGLEFAGGPHSLLVLRSVYQTSGGLKPCAALAAPVAALAFGSPPASDLAGD